jgi:hypothetical protein
MRRVKNTIPVKIVVYAVLCALLLGCEPSARRQILPFSPPPPKPPVNMTLLGTQTFSHPHTNETIEASVKNINGKMEKAQFDETLLAETLEKAKQIRTNPIPLALNRAGDAMAVGKGTKYRARMSMFINGQTKMVEVDYCVTSGMVPVSLSEQGHDSLVFREGDMVSNVGNSPIKVRNITLQEGEYFICRGWHIREIKKVERL